MKNITIFVLGFWLAVGQVLAVSPPARATVPAQAARPNIVYILADDLDETTSPYWDAMPNTARLLRDRGLTFRNAFAPTPICCPARSSILTGKYGHNTRVLTNGGDQGGWATFFRNGNENRTIAKYLQDAGYRTTLIGKYLNGIESDQYSAEFGFAPQEHIPSGWSEWNAFVGRLNLYYTGYNYQINENGVIVSYGNTAADYATDVVARKSVDFIRRAESNDAQPFFMYVAPTAPHLPLPPAPRHANNPYANSVAPRTPNYDEPDISDKPLWLRLSGDTRSRNVAIWNDIDYRNRMGSLYALDEMVRDIYNTLEANGELANTVFVFTSDNGYNLGSHRLINKMVPYEESIRVPLVIAGPGVRQGTELRFTNETDIAPTLLQLAGLPIPDSASTPNFMDGKSLVPLMRGQILANWRREILLQYVGGAAANGIGAELPPAATIIFVPQDIPTYRAIRNQRYLYVEWYDDERFGVFQDAELYDLANDRYQLNNLLSTPQGRLDNALLVNQLKSRMNQLAVCKGSSCP
jgi:arylsulfatase A-like enzyme